MNNELTPLDKEFNLDRYWNILKSRSHILIFCILLALLGGLIKSMSIVPRYSAKGVLMIAPEREGTITFNDRLAISRPNTEYFNTQVRILKSRSLARKVTEELDRSSFQPVPEATPETPEAGTKEDAGKKIAPTVNPNINAIPDQQIAVRHVDSFLSGLKVTPIRNTRLVEVSFDSLRPRRAAVAVNTVFDKYIEFNRELISRSTREASDFISQQMKELQKRLSQKEEELQNYSKDKDIFLLNNQQDAEVGKFSDLNTAVTNATIERINHQSLYLELKDKKFEDYPAVRNNSLISTLKTTHSNLEADYKRKTQLFKESYPEMTKLKTQMETLQQRINQETVNIAQQNLKDAKTQYESALKRERAMQKLLSGQKKEIVKDKTNAIHYKSLSIEVQNMRNLLDFLDRKQRETVMASSNHEGAELSNIKIIDPADVPRRPISPKRRVVLIMALLMGICGGLGLVFLMEFLDRTIKNPEDVKTLLNVPTLGLIPASNTKSLYDYYQQYANTKKKNVAKKEAKDIEMINFLAPSSPLAENYRNVRTSILLSTPQQPPKVIAISSARPEEGKTSTAVNMAIAFQQLGKKVLLIDGDLRKPRVHKIFRLKNTKGLSSFLVGRCKLTEAVWDTDVPNLSVITSGPIPPNPVELLDSDAMLSLLNDNSSKYDFIFIDSPPFVGLADPIILGKISDGLILVTWAGKTNRRFIEKAKAEIDQFGIRMLGVVLNKVNQKSGLGYQYNYQYKEEG